MNYEITRWTTQTINLRRAIPRMTNTLLWSQVYLGKDVDALVQSFDRDRADLCDAMNALLARINTHPAGSDFEKEVKAAYMALNTRDAAAGGGN